jgi:hypothetical protein
MEISAITMFRNTVKYSGDEFIWVKPVCDFFNLSVQSEYRKIKKDPILGKLWTESSTEFSKKSDQYRFLSRDLGGVDVNGRILLSRKGFIRWVQIINDKSVDNDLREKFVNYQELVFDYLYGNIDQEKKANHNYARLNKLKRLNKKIGMEIKVCQDEINLYLAGKFIQHKIDFKNSTQQKSIEG